jgi:hypothetical protein
MLFVLKKMNGNYKLYNSRAVSMFLFVLKVLTLKHNIFSRDFIVPSLDMYITHILHSVSSLLGLSGTT